MPNISSWRFQEMSSPVQQEFVGYLRRRPAIDGLYGTKVC